MRLQNIIDSIEPAVMAKIEAVIAKHEKAISDKGSDIMSEQRRNYSDNHLQELQRRYNNSLSGLMGDNRRQAAMQNMGMNGPTGVAFGSILGGCLHE